jgi:hypothetical protein
MRNSIGALLLLLVLGVPVASQTSARRQLVLQVSSGGFVAFKSETSSTNSKRTADTSSLASLIYSQALADENRIIHRVLTDGNGRVIFGYDVWINADPMTRKFSLAVLPANDSFRRTFLKEGTTPRSGDLFATFPKSTTPQTLEDGDAVSLELLVNRESGLKIVDVVRVTFDRTRLFEGSLETPPKDFTLDAVSLSVKNYELLINGNVIGKRSSSVGCEGALLWFYIPERGRFIFSLVPRDGYEFQKIGVVDGNRIQFVSNGEHYEWTSSAPILANGGSWNLWVLQDKNYTPLFSLDKPVSKPKGPNVFEKLGDAINVSNTNNGLTVTTPWPRSPGILNENNISIPRQVMVGGADSMEHLLPRNP